MATDVSTSADVRERSCAATWQGVKKRFEIGQIVRGVVETIHPYGVMFDVGESVPAFLDILDCPDNTLQVGDHWELQIVQFADWNRQIRVARPVQPDAEAE